MKREYSLRTRTASFIAVSFTLFLTLFFIFSYLSIRSALLQRSDDEAEQQLRNVLRELSDSTAHHNVVDVLREHNATGEARLNIVAYRVLPFELVHLNAPNDSTAPQLNDGQIFRLCEHPDENKTLVGATTRYLVFGMRNEKFAALAMMDMVVIEETRDAMLQQFGITLAIGVVVSIVLGFVIAGLSLAPIRMLIDAAKRLQSAPARDSAESNALRRLPIPEGVSEVALLARALNRLIDDREASIVQLLNFTADAAHELRTPLTVLKGELEVELRLIKQDNPSYETLASNLEEVERLIAIVEDLLVLARLDQHEPGLPEGSEAVALSVVLSAVIGRLDGYARARSIPISLRCITDPIVSIHRERFERMIYNIIHNAISYSEPNQPIKVRVELVDGCLAVVVQDHGIGISATDLPHLFDRFYRAEKSRSRAGGGAGLGLSIAKAIADESNLRISIQSVVHGGTTVVIVLPPS